MVDETRARLDDTEAAHSRGKAEDDDDDDLRDVMAVVAPSHDCGCCNPCSRT